MAKEFSKDFYKTKAWKKCRDSYMQSRRGLCEICLNKGLFVRAEIVHHIEELTPDNINNPIISLSFDNLKAVCRECHAELHGKRHKRYKINKLGEVELL